MEFYFDTTHNIFSRIHALITRPGCVVRVKVETSTTNLIRGIITGDCFFFLVKRKENAILFYFLKLFMGMEIAANFEVVKFTGTHNQFIG